ncbi:hypothetical protein ABIF66_001629 [Bradyrhizobium japonicum]
MLVALYGRPACGSGWLWYYPVLGIEKTLVAKKAKKATKKKTSVRREYTKADVKELCAHSKAKTPVAKIAKLTKRSEGSLRQKALKLGIKLGHRR